MDVNGSRKSLHTGASKCFSNIRRQYFIIALTDAKDGALPAPSIGKCFLII